MSYIDNDNDMYEKYSYMKSYSASKAIERGPYTDTVNVKEVPNHLKTLVARADFIASSSAYGICTNPWSEVRLSSELYLQPCLDV